MPYIKLRTIPTFETKEKYQAAKDITENLAQILSKPESTIMLDIQSVDSLFLGGAELSNGAFVQISVFGEASDSAKEVANKFICDYLKTTLSISAENIYVSYFDKNEWGYKGSYISK